MNKTLMSDSQNIDIQEQSNRKEPQTYKNRNTSHTNNTEKTLTQEQKTNFENLKRIMDGKKTTLQSLKNIDWRKVKAEKK